jgi:hypothetical protein
MRSAHGTRAVWLLFFRTMPSVYSLASQIAVLGITSKGTIPGKSLIQSRKIERQSCKLSSNSFFGRTKWTKFMSQRKPYSAPRAIRHEVGNKYLEWIKRSPETGARELSAGILKVLRPHASQQVPVCSILCAIISQPLFFAFGARRARKKIFFDESAFIESMFELT